jgi:hypothetical protein
MHLQLFNAKGDLRGDLKYPLVVKPTGIEEVDEADSFEDNGYRDVDTTPGLYMRASKQSIVSLTAPVRLTSLVCM